MELVVLILILWPVCTIWIARRLTRHDRHIDKHDNVDIQAREDTRSED